MRGVGTVVMEEDLRRDLNSGAAALLGLYHAVWEQRGGSFDHVA